MYDVIVVGGGPAGLSAALMLGRCRRKVIVFDAADPRNARSHGIHGFLTRDSILPAEFVSIARKEVEHYGVEIRFAEVTHAEKSGDHFLVQLADGTEFHSRKLLIATGVKDIVPPLRNIDLFYGSTVFHCPYCDGWEMRDRAIAVYGKGSKGIGLAEALQTWTDNIMLFTDGLWNIKKKDRERLEKANIKIYPSKIVSLEGKDGNLEYIELLGGERVSCGAMFFVTGFEMQCSLVKDLKCELSRRGVVKTDKQAHTNIEGLYVAGDASIDMHFVSVAAAEGAKAAVAINQELQKEKRF